MYRYNFERFCSQVRWRIRITFWSWLIGTCATYIRLTQIAARWLNFWSSALLCIQMQSLTTRARSMSIGPTSNLEQSTNTHFLRTRLRASIQIQRVSVESVNKVYTYIYMIHTSHKSRWTHNYNYACTYTVAPILWGTGAHAPHFYKWLGSGAPWAGWVSE